MDMPQALLPPRLQQRMSQRLRIPELLLSLYIHLAPEQFYDEQERILWALTFFKGGRTAKWSKNIFHQEADTGIFPIQT